MRILVHGPIQQLSWKHRGGSGFHSRTFKQRADLPDGKRPQAGELPE